jgi:hypothetical protein
MNVQSLEGVVLERNSTGSNIHILLSHVHVSPMHVPQRAKDRSMFRANLSMICTLRCVGRLAVLMHR